MSLGPRASGAGWAVGAAAIAALVLLPIVSLAISASGGATDLWSHLFAYVLPPALADTAVLLAGVGILTATIGAGTAWLVVAYDFPGRRVFQWALLLPLAVPTYIVAYAYLDVLHPVGPVQNTLRALLGIDSPRDFRLPDIRSMAGCIVLLSFVLYPYVYLTARAVFLLQSGTLLDAARTLGVRRGGLWLRVAVPLARPAIVAGVTLALLEALNDVGAAEFLGVRTLTVTVYSTWIAQSNLAGAAQIALAMLLVVVVLVSVERWARRQRGYENEPQPAPPAAPHRLSRPRAAAAIAACAVPIVAGFGVPAAYLLHAAVTRVRAHGVPDTLLREAWNTFWVAAAATAVVVPSALIVVFALRLGRTRWRGAVARAAALGYAVPGTVLAIGVLPIVSGIDGVVYRATAAVTGGTPGLLLLGSGAALVYAYWARFLAVAIGGVEAGFGRIPSSLDDAARTLGQAPGGTLRRVHLPLLRPALGGSALLVLIDALKELPATLLLRPVGFETLATHLYGEAVRGTYEDAAVAALLIVAVGIVPVVVLSRLR